MKGLKQMKDISDYFIKLNPKKSVTKDSQSLIETVKKQYIEEEKQQQSENPIETQNSQQQIQKADVNEKTEILQNTKIITEFPPFDDFCDQLYSWKPMLQKYISSKPFQNTYNFVKQEYATKKCYPPPELIFNAFKLTSLDQLKVVIVGQDPYHQPQQAMGLCFSVPKTIPPPPSLKNIYKSIKNDPDISGFITPKHGDLTKWATQGVFLLNDILTVVDSSPESHKSSGWAGFTDEVIKLINLQCNSIVFMLWGKPAQKKASIVNESKHLVLKTSHPSPLGVKYGFLDAKHFSRCNKFLKRIGKAEIDWNLE